MRLKQSFNEQKLHTIELIHIPGLLNLSEAGVGWLAWATSSGVNLNRKYL